MAELGADSVSRLIELLATEHQHFTSIEIAETLWLAMQIESAAAVAPIVASVEKPIDLPPSERSENNLDLDPAPLPLAKPAPKANLAVATPQAGILPPQTLPVWLADPAMLQDSLAIVRALKPLLGKVSAGIEKRLDEPATVENIARTSLCLPVMQPEQEQWFDIVLVVDRGSSMHIWQRLIKDILRILRHYGAFRDVQVFDLVVNQAGRSITDDVIQLISKPQRPSHRASELIDQSGRRIVMVLSDCAGVYWWDGTLLPMLQEWGKAMPTVVWQMLPAWMWKRTALGRGTAVALNNNDIPGVANRRLQVKIQERGAPDYDGQRMPVPIMTSEVPDLALWSLMVAGDRRAVTPGFLLPLQGGAVPRSKSLEEIAGDRAQQRIDRGSEASIDDLVHEELEIIAGDRVQRFLELSSPEAQRLMALLSAAPVITLPVVRLIRDAMLYDVQSPLPVAEVFLSGLLQRLPGQEDVLKQVLQEAENTAEQLQLKLAGQELNEQELAEAPELELLQFSIQDLVQYDFAPNVRRLLWKLLPAVDTIEVINSVSAAVESRWQRFSREDFRAFLTNPNLVAPEGLTGLRSFANITADILESLGGAYASFVEELRSGAAGNSPPNTPTLEESFPLEDLKYESATITAILDRFDFETAQIRRQTSLFGLRNEWKIDRRSSFTWGYTENLSDVTTESVGLDMIAIPGGSFQMGAPTDEPDGQSYEKPQHEVTIQPFYLGRYPITQAQWRVVAGYELVKKELNPDPSRFKDDNLPVESISWEDAQEFCQRLSIKTSKTYRLPSEAEWEYACRAGTTTPFHFGETISSDLANYDGSETYNNSPKGEYRSEMTAVGIFPANDWGLHDMHGNVWEWCEDDWHSNYEGAPRDGIAWIELNKLNTSKMVRGGSWIFNPIICRSASRLNLDDFYDYVGFRVVCEPPRILLSP
jgi:formylglycine-generating enzyme required for sulfatase activity